MQYLYFKEKKLLFIVFLFVTVEFLPAMEKVEQVGKVNIIVGEHVQQLKEIAPCIIRYSMGGMHGNVEEVRFECKQIMLPDGRFIASKVQTIGEYGKGRKTTVGWTGNAYYNISESGGARRVDAKWLNGETFIVRESGEEKYVTRTSPSPAEIAKRFEFMHDYVVCMHFMPWGYSQIPDYYCVKNQRPRDFLRWCDVMDSQIQRVAKKGLLFDEEKMVLGVNRDSSTVSFVIPCALNVNYIMNRDVEKNPRCLSLKCRGSWVPRTIYISLVPDGSSRNSSDNEYALLHPDFETEIIFTYSDIAQGVLPVFVENKSFINRGDVREMCSHSWSRITSFEKLTTEDAEAIMAMFPLTVKNCQDMKPIKKDK